MSIRTFSLLFAFIALCVPSLTGAQTAAPPLGGTYIAGVSLEVTPEIPAPFGRVSAQLKSFSIDLDRADTTWYLNDKIVLSGVGKKQFSFTVGGVGTHTDLNVVIIDERFGTTTRNVVFKPLAIDFLWESPDSYTPPFYRGKALPGPESRIKIVALPNDALPGVDNSAPETFVYTWSKDGRFRDFNAQSGYGRRALSFTLSLFDVAPTIGVRVESSDKETVGENRVVIRRIEPFLRFYEDRPLQGVWYERAISEQFAMQESESALIVEPYFFSVKNSVDTNISYSWRVDQETLPSGSGRTLVLRAPASGGGSSSISLTARHVSKVLQTAAKSFVLQFNDGGSDSSSIFGNI